MQRVQDERRAPVANVELKEAAAPGGGASMGKKGRRAVDGGSDKVGWGSGKEERAEEEAEEDVGGRRSGTSPAGCRTDGCVAPETGDSGEGL